MVNVTSWSTTNYSRGARPGRLGFAGPGGGKWSHVASPRTYRGTTVQVCGLWPFGVGSSTPAVGIPMGHHLYTGDTVCFDPISWYTRTTLISSPSVFILGKPAKGKSTAVRRMVLGSAARGITPLILGDLKPDYAQLVTALGGQVIRVGPGLDRINPLDVGPWREVLARVDDKTAHQVRARVIDRRLNMIVALATLVREGRITSDEVTVLTACLRHLATREGTEQPVLSDVLRTIQEGPPEVRTVTLYHGDTDTDRAEYQRDTAGLQRILLALLNGPLGDSLDGQTTAAINLDTSAVCVDISGIDESDRLRTAAMLLSTWSYGFAQVDAAHLLSDLGLAPPRTFFTVLDEMWRALRVGHGLVDRVDALTRLDRQKGTGVAYVTHGLADLQALPTEEDRAKARGFADRSAVLMIGPSTETELDSVGKVTTLSRAERREILGWSAPDNWSGTGDQASAGLGHFLLKVGGRPGIPVYLSPTDTEKALGNTDHRWDVSGRAGGGRR